MLKGRMLYSTSGLVAVAVLLVAINLFAGLTIKGIRFDMTENRLVHAVGRYPQHSARPRRTHHAAPVFFGEAVQRSPLGHHLWSTGSRAAGGVCCHERRQVAAGGRGARAVFRRRGAGRALRSAGGARRHRRQQCLFRSRRQQFGGRYPPHCLLPARPGGCAGIQCFQTGIQPG